MSVRRRAIRARVERKRARDDAFMRSGVELSLLGVGIDRAISERDGHRRMDDDGAPPTERHSAALYFRGCEIVWDNP